MLTCVLQRLKERLLPDKLYYYDIFPVATGTDLDGADYHGIHRFILKDDDNILYETSFNVYDFVKDKSFIIPDDVYYDNQFKYQQDEHCIRDSQFHTAIVNHCLGPARIILNKPLKADKTDFNFGSGPHTEYAFKLNQIKKQFHILSDVAKELKYIKKSEEFNKLHKALSDDYIALISFLSEQAKNYVLKKREIKRALRRK